MTFQILRHNSARLSLKRQVEKQDTTQTDTKINSPENKKSKDSKNNLEQKTNLNVLKQKSSTSLSQDRTHSLDKIFPEKQLGLSHIFAFQGNPFHSNNSSLEFESSVNTRPLPALTATAQTKIKISRRDPQNHEKKIVFDRDPIWLDKAHADLIALSSRKGLFRGSILLNYYLTKKYNWPILNLTRGSELFNQNSRPRTESQNYIREYIIRKKLDTEFRELADNTEALENRISAIREHGENVLKRLEPSQTAEALQDFIKDEDQTFIKSSHIGNEVRDGAKIVNYKTFRIKGVDITADGKLQISGFKQKDTHLNFRTYVSENTLPENLVKEIQSPNFKPKVILGPGYHEYVKAANEQNIKDKGLIDSFQQEIKVLKNRRSELLSEIEPVEAVAKRTNAWMKTIAILGTTATLVNIGIGSRLDGYDRQLNEDGTSDPTRSDYALGRRTWGNIGGLIGGVTGSYFAVKTLFGKNLAGWGMSKHVFEANKIHPERLSTRAAMSLPQNIIFGNPFAFTGRLIGISLYDWKEGGYKSSFSSEDKEILARDVSYAWADYSLGAIGSGWLGAKLGSHAGYRIGEKWLVKKAVCLAPQLAAW